MSVEDYQLPAVKDENLAEERGSILVVDDDSLVLNAIKMTLKKEGYSVLTAEDGPQAIEILKTSSPAIIICDQWLPGMNGIEVLQKAQEMVPHTIRILLTASHNLETAIQAINIGRVSQYITKPWDDKHLREVVKTNFERYKLVKENQVLQNLIFNQHKKLKKAHENLRQELQLGAKIHEQLLLGKVPEDVPELIVKAMSYPSRDIDGDFFDFYRPVPYILDMTLGDVMGKGLASALVGIAVKTQMLRFSMPFPSCKIYDSRQGWRDGLLSPEKILTNVNEEIADELIDLGYFVSLFYGRFDLQYKTFSYLDCGSPRAVHYKAREDRIEQLLGENFPIGVVEKPEFQIRKTFFSEGDVFVFYSDGITEARSPKNELFGVDRIKELVSRFHHLRAEALMDIIHRAVMMFTRKEKFDDDLTLVVIKVEGSSGPEVVKYAKTRFPCELSQLSNVRAFVGRICSKAPGDSARLSSEMQLVLNEAFSNIVKHGLKDGCGKEVVISAELAREGVIFNIEDQGIPHDPSEVNEPSFCGTRDTGYGWYIMKELSDSITYSRKKDFNDWNHLSIYKRYYFGESTMNIVHKQEGNILVIIPEGQTLDARDATDFREKVMQLINEGDMSGVVFDLSHLEFIDSSGLGSFLSILRHLNSRGGDVKLSQMSKQLRTMFELVKMHKIFEIYNSTDEAVVSFE